MLVAFIPWGIAFGAAHALTPGHSKMVLALFVGGSSANLGIGLRTAAILATTHIFMSIFIGLLGLPLVSMSFGEVGKAIILQNLSRGLLGVVGLRMIIAALWTTVPHSHGQGTAFGFTAGLIPCPLTLLVMTFAVTHKIPEAGFAFAAMTLIGVGLVLGTVAAGAILLRTGISASLIQFTSGIAIISRVTMGLTGTVLVLVAVLTLIENT